MKDITKERITFYSGQFFMDTLQHQWMVYNLLRERKLESLPDELQKIAHSSIPGKLNYLKFDSSWGCLDQVGNSMLDSDMDYSENHIEQLRKNFYDFITPPTGFKVVTKKQRALKVTAVISFLAVGGFIIYSGGLGLFGTLAGTGGSLTGGYGWATLSAITGIGIASSIYASMPSRYHVMLEDLLKIYTGQIPSSKNEMKQEDALIEAAESYDEKRADGKFDNRKFSVLHKYEISSQEMFRITLCSPQLGR